MEARGKIPTGEANSCRQRLSKQSRRSGNEHQRKPSRHEAKNIPPSGQNPSFDAQSGFTTERQHA